MPREPEGKNVVTERPPISGIRQNLSIDLLPSHSFENFHYSDETEEVPGVSGQTARTKGNDELSGSLIEDGEDMALVETDV
jgi:hypothetical protein